MLKYIFVVMFQNKFTLMYLKLNVDQFQKCILILE